MQKERDVSSGISAKGEEQQQIQREGWLIQAEGRGEPVARHHILNAYKNLQRLGM